MIYPCNVHFFGCVAVVYNCAMIMLMRKMKISHILKTFGPTFIVKIVNYAKIIHLIVLHSNHKLCSKGDI